MAVVISDLDDAVDYLNTLAEADSSAPASDEEDYSVWTALFNIAINIWENEEGILWRELFVKLADAADGDKTTAAGDNSYDCSSNFSMPACGYVWLGTGQNKTAYKVIPLEEGQLHSIDTERWCYFTVASPSLEFNPNLTIIGGYTINYEYYKTADKVSDGADTFDMADPMFAVFYALSVLTKEEGAADAVAIATQKLEAMKTKNVMPAWFQEDNLMNKKEVGFGV